MPPHNIPLPDRAWEKVAIDITGPYENAPCHLCFNVVLIDYFSKYPEVLSTSDTTSTNIIRWLKDIFAHYGNPSTLVSDNGPQFISAEFESFLQSCDIAHECSPVYWPQYNGLVEVFNQYINHNIQTFNSSHVKWLDGIRDALFQFRATAPTPDGKSPAELFFNRPMRMNSEVVRTRRGGGVAVAGATGLDGPTTAQLPFGNGPVRSVVAKTTPSKPAFPGPYKLNDRVRVRLPQVPKCHSKYSKPLKVVKVLGHWTYRLSDGFIWNARKMRKVYEQLPQQYVDHDDEIQLPIIQAPVPVAEAPVLRRSSRTNFGKPPDRYSPGPGARK